MYTCVLCFCSTVLLCLCVLCSAVLLSVVSVHRQLEKLSHVYCFVVSVLCVVCQKQTKQVYLKKN